MNENEITTRETDLETILKDDYEMKIIPFKGELKSSDKSLIPVPKDLAAELSVVTSSFPTLAANFAANDALSRTAYSITFNGKDVFPGELWQKKNGSFISNLKGEGSRWGSQTDLNVIDNTAAKGAMVASSVFAVASVATSMYYMKSINDKLSDLQDTTKAILSFLETDKQSKIQADMEILRDIADNMKAIKANASLKAMKENQLSNIQRDAKANIHFYEKRVNEQLSKYTSSGRKDKKHYEQLRKDYMLLQFCLQEYSVSRLLEIDLTNNYSQDQLQKTRTEIEDLSQSYKDLNKSLRHEISEHFLWKKPQNVIPALASGAVYGIGEVVKKTPLGETGLDEKLIAVGEHGFDKLDRREERHTAKVLNDKKGVLLDPFSQKLHFMEKVCCEPVEIIYDGEDAYLKIED